MSWRDAPPPVRGKLLRDEPLAPYTWFRVGGAADVLFIPADADDLADFLKALDPAVPVTVLGVGSNVIVRDGGIEGVVIRLAGRAWGQVTADGDTITAGAGALDSMVARASAKAGLAGLEFYAGIPGAVGGALTMNAGLPCIEARVRLDTSRAPVCPAAGVVRQRRSSWRQRVVLLPLVPPLLGMPFMMSGVARPFGDGVEVPAPRAADPRIEDETDMRKLRSGRKLDKVRRAIANQANEAPR